MNSTKWKEFIDSVSKLEDLNPKIRYQCITSDEIFGFSQVWWNELYEICAEIKWLEIDPVKKEFRGKLVSDKETDYSDLVSSLLSQANIPYSIEGRYFKVWGYIGKNDNPEFV